MAATDGAARQAAAAASAPISARCIQKGWPPLYPGYAAARVGRCCSRGGGEDRECFDFLTPTECSFRLTAAGSVEANAPLEASASAAADTLVEVGAGASVKAGTAVGGSSGRLRISTGGAAWW